MCIYDVDASLVMGVRTDDVRYDCEHGLCYSSTACIELTSYNSTRTAAEIFQSRLYIRPPSLSRGAPLQLVRTALVCHPLKTKAR